LNPPAGTIWTKVIDVFGSTRDDKLSHDAAALRAGASIINARRTAHDPVTVFIAVSPEVLTRSRAYRIPLTQEFGRSAASGGHETSFSEGETAVLEVVSRERSVVAVEAFHLFP
jgi:hypothetical protein